MISLDKELSTGEKLVWKILFDFEALALEQYREFAPSLNTSEKTALVEALERNAPDFPEERLQIKDKLAEVLAAACHASEIDTLLVQGLMLESLARSIYGMIKELKTVNANLSQICDLGIVSSEVTTSLVPERLEQLKLSSDLLLHEFMRTSAPILRQLDFLAEMLDADLTRDFGINYADLMADFGTELIHTCTSLGMDRRKIAGYLTAALMMGSAA